MPNSSSSSLRLQYYRSAIGRTWRQKQIVRGLGFTKLNQVVERPDNPAIRGMVTKIPHLVRIVASPPAAAAPAAPAAAAASHPRRAARKS